MNIVCRVHLWPPDHCAGAERMMEQLLEGLAKRGHRCQVHLSRFSRTKEPFTKNGVEIFPRDTADWQSEARKADVLITHLDNTSTMVNASLFYKKPLVQVLHNTHIATRMWASCKNDLLVYNSEWMAKELGNHENGIIVRPPVKLEDYQVAREKPVAVTLVNLNQEKGGVLFAQLAAMLPALQFLGVEGAYGEQVRPNLPNVTVVPHGANMRRVYSDTKLLVMPSEYESWGRVGIEAMCSGIPVLASPTPGLLESLGGAGRFVYQGDAHAWKTKLMDLLGDARVYQHASVEAASRARQICFLSQQDLIAFCDRVEKL